MLEGFSTLTIVKLGLMLAGAALFFYAVRVENEMLRWVAIGVVAVAFLLRFAGRRDRKHDAPDGESPKPR